MNKNEFEKQHDVKVICKSESKLMSLIGWFFPAFMTYFWTTYRLPFGKPTITYPTSVSDPMKSQSVLEHELVHCKDMRSGWGLFKMFWLVWLLPMPIIFSGRWFIERHAYLHNILNHGYELERAVSILWNGYGWAWPKPLMRRWFEKAVKKHKGV